jgi:hypothetical protein
MKLYRNLMRLLPASLALNFFFIFGIGILLATKNERQVLAATLTGQIFRIDRYLGPYPPPDEWREAASTPQGVSTSSSR